MMTNAKFEAPAMRELDLEEIDAVHGGSVGEALKYVGTAVAAGVIILAKIVTGQPLPQQPQR
jgi:hypothetical protein